MGAKIKGLLPLAVTAAVLVFLWVEIALNFTFHWVTVADPGIGIGLPQLFHLTAPAAFVTWGFYFAAGTGKIGFQKAACGSVIGAVFGLLLMLIGPNVAKFPDFWGLSVTALGLAFLLIIGMALSDLWYVPAAFGGFASIVFWWTATGLDRWSVGGGGTGNTTAALGDTTTAGAGAFGGVLSTPVIWVFVSVTVSLLAGCVLGLLHTTITAKITPKTGQ